MDIKWDDFLIFVEANTKQDRLVAAQLAAFFNANKGKGGKSFKAEDFL